jgi:hypothetical protein
LNRFCETIMGRAAALGGVKGALFKQAFEAKKYWLHHGNFLTHGVWDRLVFTKTKAALGLDRCRLVLTGSAPIAEHVLEFLRVLMGCVWGGCVVGWCIWGAGWWVRMGWWVGGWCVAPGACYLVPGAWCLVPGVWCVGDGWCGRLVVRGRWVASTFVVRWVVCMWWMVGGG